MKCRFYIEKRKGEDGRLLTRERPVFMTVAFKGKRVLISSGRKIDMDWWDSEQQKVREEHPEAVVLNSWFSTMKETATAAWKSISHMNDPDVTSFREAYKKLKPAFSTGFFDVFYQFMEDGSSRWNKSTYSKVRTVYNHLKAFEEEHDGDLNFRGMDSDFLTKFRNFYKNKGNNATSTLKAVNTIVWFLNWATKQRYNIFTTYRNFYKDLKSGADPVSDRPLEIYLEWEELMDIYTFPGEEPRWQRARDIFCFMCFTGIRYSELQGLSKDHILEKRIVVNKQSAKTRIVPLNKYAGEIIHRYENKYYRNNAALPVMSLVTLNKYIKMIALSVGVAKKAAWITAGTAPVTFIVNALKLDIPAEIISTYTGVSNDRRIKLLKQKIAAEEIKKFDLL
jgi:integrase